MRAPRYELPTPPPHNLGGPSSPYRSRGQGGREHPHFTDWEGEAREGKATATAGQCPGWLVARIPRCPVVRPPARRAHRPRDGAGGGQGEAWE